MQVHLLPKLRGTSEELIMGRKKIEIKMLKDSNTRQVTFSKRKTGLFKKANELSILCGCEVAVVVFSPGKKPYSFGHPDISTVATKFLQQESNSNSAQCSSSSNDDNSVRLNQLAEVMDQLYEEEKRGEILDVALHQFKKTQLDKVKDLHHLAELRCKIKARIDEMEVAETMLKIKEQPVVFCKNYGNEGNESNDV
ncbi:unnamed protein product [Lupinus luteus]|uniref:MADS-box domain-containing protein n=1 Tax=Lupinus luteus TaxID=3873 RepID=A0AAV1Y2U7_LUPLU